MLEAFKKCLNNIQDLYWLFIGDGSWRSELEFRLNEMGLKNNSIFTGFIQAEDLWHYLPACDAGLIISTKKDVIRYGPISTKFSTYGMFKLPVIATGYNLNGYPTQLGNGVILAEPEKSEELAKSIMWVYEHPEAANKKGNELQNFVKKNMTWDSISEQIIKQMTKSKKVLKM